MPQHTKSEANSDAYTIILSFQTFARWYDNDPIRGAKAGNRTRWSDVCFELKLDTLLAKFRIPAVLYLLAQKVKILLNERRKPTLFLADTPPLVWCRLAEHLYAVKTERDRLLDKKLWGHAGSIARYEYCRSLHKCLWIGLGQISSHCFGRDPPEGNDCSKSLGCCRWSLRKKKEQLEEAGDLAGANAIPPPGALRTLSQTGLCSIFLWSTHNLSEHSQGDPPKKKKGFFEATWSCLMCVDIVDMLQQWSEIAKKTETLPLAPYVGDIQGWGLGLTGRDTQVTMK